MIVCADCLRPIVGPQPAPGRCPCGGREIRSGDRFRFEGRIVEIRYITRGGRYASVWLKGVIGWISARVPVSKLEPIRAGEADAVAHPVPLGVLS